MFPDRTARPPPVHASAAGSAALGLVSSSENNENGAEGEGGSEGEGEGEGGGEGGGEGE